MEINPGGTNNSEQIPNTPDTRNEYSGVDLSTIDGGRLIFPSKAEGSDVHRLSVENINLPVSFTILDSGHFRLNGLMEDSDKGVVVSGITSKELAKINHIKVDEELRVYAKEHGNIRIGEAVLADLEQSLKKTGVENVYAVFYNRETVSFFLRNGYDILPIQSLIGDQKTTLDIDEEGFDERITDNESFLKLKNVKDQNIKHVFLKKQLVKNKEDK